MQQLVAQLPWGHNRVLLTKVKNQPEREWYIRACIKDRWSRSILEMQIQSGLYAR